MTEPRVSPYGAWKSPITADVIVAGAIGLGQPQLDGGYVYWLERRPGEGGRSVVTRMAAGGEAEDVTPAPFNARTRVHEYGGGSYLAAAGVVYFANYADQRLYGHTPGSPPQPHTPEAEYRFADMVMDHGRQQLIAVREDHTLGGEVVNTLVAITLGGEDAGRVLVAGNDFYAAPRLSPDGRRLAWLTWNHPDMPWDSAELWVGELEEDGCLVRPHRVAGGPAESVVQPEWSPDGTLYFVSDRTGWWNLHRLVGGEPETLCGLEAEFAGPQWVFGSSTYAFTGPDRLVCTYGQRGFWRLGIVDLAAGKMETLATPFTEIGGLRASGDAVYFLAGSAAEAGVLVRYDLAARQAEVLRHSSSIAVDPDYISEPQPIEFPTTGGETAHAYYYPPRNRDFAAPPGERPPLLVMSHGGPTGSASPTLSWETQFWTSRGIAVLDVNYGGSTGYGRAYRERLYGRWGEVDVDDCVNGALYLVEQGLADGDRLAITGGSAGGYTTLCALTFRDVFKAGASHFGVSDLEALARDTHKFESRYLDRLIGPYSEGSPLYRERSPIHFVERISCPVALFQGLEDRIVPPSQSERIHEALRAKGIPVAYVAFEGEQHGFRRAENIKRALDGELYFYSRIFGFPLADPVEPIPIDNLPT